jgi:hypothetical protein
MYVTTVSILVYTGLTSKIGIVINKYYQHTLHDKI